MSYGIRKRRSAWARLSAWLAILLFMAALGSAGWTYYQLYVVSPRLATVLVRVNGEPRELLSGDHLALHPRDRVKILKISTNIPLNFYVRLVSPVFDVGALRYKEWPILRLLPGQNMFEAYHFPVRIKYRNRTLGGLTLDVRPRVDDWLDKADRTIDKKLRLSVLEKASAMFPEETRLKKRLLEAYREQGKWKRVAAMLERTVGGKADRAALTSLLESYRATGNLKGVISALKRLIAMNPTDLETRLELARAFEKQKNLKSAASTYEAAVEKASGEGKLPLYDKLGYLWSELGNPKKAIIFYQKAAAIDPKDANLYYNLSYLFEKTGNRKESLYYLEKAVALRSGDIEGRMKIVHELVRYKEWKKAEDLLSQVLKDKPKSKEALFLMADVLDKTGKKSELRAIYRRILSLDPDNVIIGYNLGALEYETGNLKGALPYLVGYVEKHGKDMETHGILLDIYRKLKEPKKAFIEAHTLTKLGTRDLDVYLFAAEYLSKQGQYKQLIPIAKKGLHIQPKTIELRNYLVVAYLKNGREKDAVGEMERILKMDPKNLRMLQDLARLREKQGDYTGAVSAYEKVIALDPGNEAAQNAYFKLRLKVIKSEKGN